MTEDRRPDPAPDSHVGSPTSGRVRSLDGARGLAALSVLVCHTLLCTKTGFNAYANQHDPTLSGPWWLSQTPLRILWDGNGAVLLFFVLSGYVLTLQMTRPGARWREYFPHRAFRLYLPILAAIGLASLIVAAVPRVSRAAQSGWVNLHGLPHQPTLGASSLSLLKPPVWVDGPLWSLKWEILFSLFLPSYLLLGRLIAKAWVGGVIGLIILSGYGLADQQAALRYMPMFGVGVLLCTGRDDVARITARWSWRRWVPLLILVPFLTNLYWQFPPTDHGRLVTTLTSMARLSGFALLLAVTAHWSAARRFGERRPMQWLGKRSFSLYLVHEPLVVSVAVLSHGNVPVILLLAVPLSLAAAEVFYRCLETPFNRFAKDAGQLARRVGTRPQVQPAA